MTTPLVDDETSPESTETPVYGDPVEPGYLLDETLDEAKVCQHVHRLWEAQRDSYARLLCEGEVNERRRLGEGNIWVEKVEDVGRYTIYVPYGKQIPNQFYRKPDRLCHRFVSQLYADPAEPEAEPSTGEDTDRDSAQMTTRVLKDVASEAVLDDQHAHKLAQQKACSWGSGYLWYYTDPRGGGRQPMEVLAAPEAQTVDEALYDPASGTPWPSPAIVRYVQEDGTLTDSRDDAALRWLPRLARQLAGPANIRLLPENAGDLWDADGVLYACYETWETLTNWFPALADMGPEERDHAVGYRHPDTRYLLRRDGRVHDPRPPQGLEQHGKALLMILWRVECGDYPDGAMVVTVGDRLCPHRGEWLLRRAGKRERRDLPFTQVKQFYRDNDPHGQGLMHFFGPAGEYDAQLHGAFADWLDKSLNRKIFLPSHSPYQPQDAQLQFATVIPLPPGAEPRYEEVPPVPRELGEMIERNRNEMEQASGLNEAGSELKNTESGRHALAVVSQVQAGLADVNQNANRARVRGWRIQLQEIQANYTVPQQLKWVGEDGSYKVQRWTGSDLGSTRDVRIARGTGTMLNPVQKVQLATEFGTAAGLMIEEVQEMISGGLQGYLQLQDDPVRQRIRRQVSEWEQGPPPNWQPPQAPPPQVLGVDPMSGQPIMAPPMPPPPDPLLARIWEPVPADRTPPAARIRIRELVLAMSRAKYLTFPPPWRVPVEMEFQAMGQVLAPPPMMAPPPKGDGKPGGTEPPAPMAGSATPPPLQQGEQAVLGQSTTQPAGTAGPGA